MALSRAFIGSFWTALAVCLATAFAQGAEAPAPSHWPAASRVLAIADIHGSYPAATRVLQQGELLGPGLSWRGGDSHLVVVGDMLDRGPDSRQTMELFMRLEREARDAGGRVHVLLGNHEVMNLLGDLRYVSAADYQAFAPEETPATRNSAFEHYRQREWAGDARGITRAEFDRRFPAGYFAHRRAFRPDGRYGAWLLQKPVIAVIGQTAFVHGGFSTVFNRLDSDTINAQLGATLNQYVDLVTRLVDAGVLSEADSFPMQAGLARSFLDSGAGSPEQQRLASALVNFDLDALMSRDSPLWYRGNVGCNEISETQTIKRALASLGAERLVLGHSPTPGRQVVSRFETRLIRIDTGMAKEFYGGQASLLRVENGELAVAYEDSGEWREPRPQPAALAWSLAGIGQPMRLTKELHDARVLRINSRDLRETRMAIELNGRRHAARFTPAGAGQPPANPEVAAYRLDQALGLDLVLPAVATEVGGRQGALQLMPDRYMNEAQRRARGLGAAAWCNLAGQAQDMRIFDALIGNTGRTPQSVLYGTSEFRMMLFNHERAFGQQHELPARPGGVDPGLSREWIRRLRALDRSRLQELLGDVLSAAAIDALIARRDRLIAGAPGFRAGQTKIYPGAAGAEPARPAVR